MSFRPAARQFFGRRGAPTPPLPYDAEVAWLGNSGGAYIDTGVVCSRIQGIRARYMITSWASYGAVFNSYVNEASNATRVITQSANNGKGYASLNTKAQGSLELPLALNTWYDYEASVSGGVFRAVVNNQNLSIAYTNGTSNSKTVVLFSSSVSARLSSFVLYGSNGDALIDVIPVRFTNSNHQSEGAMYDRVSGSLFRNAGTGSFTWQDKT